MVGLLENAMGMLYVTITSSVDLHEWQLLRQNSAILTKQIEERTHTHSESESEWTKIAQQWIGHISIGFVVLHR